MKPNTVGRVNGAIPSLHPVYPEPNGSNAHCNAPFENGLTAGTIVLSMDGEMPVEFLCAGDRVITRDSGMARLTEVVCTTQTLRMISFAAGSLGDTRPDQDLILPAAQLVLIRDWRAQAMFNQRQAIVPAQSLIDGEFIRDLGPQETTLYHLRFADEHVIYAGGLELAGTGPTSSDLRPAA